MTVNRVILVGHLGADPETKTTQGGTTVANLRIATSERRKDRDGNWSDHTEWHRAVCFGKTAENAAKYLKKGRQVYIEGALKTSKYEKDGQTRYSTDVVVRDLKFLSSPQSGGDSRGGGDYDPGDYGPY